MQYRQRKLHLSVTETRRLRISRPQPSTSASIWERLAKVLRTKPGGNAAQTKPKEERMSEFEQEGQESQEGQEGQEESGGGMGGGSEGEESGGGMGGADQTEGGTDVRVRAGRPGKS